MLVIRKRPLQDAHLLHAFITLLPNPHDKLAFFFLLFLERNQHWGEIQMDPKLGVLS